MSDTGKVETLSPATDADGKLLLSGAEADAVLRECFAQLSAGLTDLVRGSMDSTNDLFEMNEFVSDAQVIEFRNKRDEWVKRFGETFAQPFDKRIAGVRRQGRRPDFDASLTTLRVLNAFDQEKQAALTAATQSLSRVTKREVDALDLRVGVLLREPRARDVDNPFAPNYILDAVGLSSRAVYPNPRVWRPLMERMLSDLPSGIRKVYIKANRFLADRHVLPEIKAELRARSDLRPRDDAELLSTFFQLFKDTGASAADELLALNIQVPAASASNSTLPQPPPVKAPSAQAAPAGQVASQVATPIPAPAAGGAPQSAGIPASSMQVMPAQGGGPGQATMQLPPLYLYPGAHPQAGGPATAQESSGSGAAGSGAQGFPSGFIAATPGTYPPMPPGPVPGLGWTVSANPYAADIAHIPPPSSNPAGTNAMGLPQLDPMLALGSLSAAIAVLDRWQRADPGGASATGDGETTAEGNAAAPPLNRIPFIRSAIADKVGSSTDKITMDVIGLLFDYIFRDPSIPPSLRSVFSRLQVPILKTALLDRSFFSDRKHPARRLLDHLAAAAVGATGDAGYAAAFELIATGVVDEVCREFKVDISAFEGADAKLIEFVDGELTKAAPALDKEVEQALAAEESEADRANVRALIRDKLAGVEVPFAVRSFSETIWADYLTSLRATEGTQSDAWASAVKTLDDLLWSITAKDRSSQKARLAKMVPPLIKNLRNGGLAVKVANERLQPFLESVYQLHMAAIKPTTEGPAPSPLPLEPIEGMDTRTRAIGNVHDFVSEMVIGTWLSFKSGGAPVNARLSWVSPLRSKYIFTSRERTRAIVLTPEELAWRLGSGKASLVVEPVPLFDRAVSAALDSLATQKKTSTQAAAA